MWNAIAPSYTSPPNLVRIVTLFGKFWEALRKLWGGGQRGSTVDRALFLHMVNPDSLSYWGTRYGPPRPQYCLVVTQYISPKKQNMNY